MFIDRLDNFFFGAGSVLSAVKVAVGQITLVAGKSFAYHLRARLANHALLPLQIRP